MTGIEAFARERQRQIGKEGYDRKHDMQHSPEDLIAAAICYATPPETRVLVGRPIYAGSGWVKERIDVPAMWPWGIEDWKPTTRERDLEKAGALLAAAYDRIQAEKNAAQGEAPAT